MEFFIKTIENYGLVQVLTIILAFILLVLFIEKVIKWVLGKFNWYHKSKTEEENISKSVQSHTDEIKTLVDSVDKLYKIVEQDRETNRRVDSAILRDRIIQACKYHKQNGCKLSALDKENLDKMFMSYFDDCHGNGLLHGLHDDFETWEVGF